MTPNFYLLVPWWAVSSFDEQEKEFVVQQVKIQSDQIYQDHQVLYIFWYSNNNKLEVD